jgi:tetratricopeptide (TPR) repeat protein
VFPRRDPAAGQLLSALQQDGQQTPPLLTRLSLARARVAAANGDQSALTTLSAAYTEFARTGIVTDTAMAGLEYDSALASAGRHRERLEWLPRVEAWATTVVGAHSAFLITLMNRRAVALDMAGRTDDAIALNRIVAAEAEREFGANHAYTVRCRANIAVLLQRQGHFDDALAQHEQVLRARIANDDDPEGIAVTHEAMAGLLVTRSRALEANSHCIAAIESRDKRLPSVHPDHYRAYDCLATTAKALGRAGESAAARARAAVLACENLGAQSPPCAQMRAASAP